MEYGWFLQSRMKARLVSDRAIVYLVILLGFGIIFRRFTKAATHCWWTERIARKLKFWQALIER